MKGENGKEKSGATNEMGAPDIRIVVPLELVLTPWDENLLPSTWTRWSPLN
jgi:hypothetical protein